MINLLNSYRINYVKASNGGKTTFGIRDYNKEKPDEKNYARVCATNSIVLKDGDEISIDKITGVGLSRYEGALQVMIFAIVRLSKSPKTKQTEIQHEEKFASDESQSPAIIQDCNRYESEIEVSIEEMLFETGQTLLDIDPDDLPF